MSPFFYLLITVAVYLSFVSSVVLYHSLNSDKNIPNQKQPNNYVLEQRVQKLTEEIERLKEHEKVLQKTINYYYRVETPLVVEQLALINEKLGGNENERERPYLRLFIGILSSYNNSEKRDAIRETWLNYLWDSPYKSSFKYKFFLGDTHDEHQRMEAKAENEKYNDIEFLFEVEDTYDTISYKVLSMTSWAIARYRFDYMLKIDDDTFLRLDRLMEELESRPLKKFYMGFNMGTYKTPEVLNLDVSPFKVPTVLVGMAYVYSYDCARYMADRYSNDDDLVIDKAEDINTALILDEIGVKGVHNTKWKRHYCTCKEDMIASHYCLPEHMKLYYANSREAASMCEGVVSEDLDWETRNENERRNIEDKFRKLDDTSKRTGMPRDEVKWLLKLRGP